MPEVASDVKTAEGLIARARGDHKGVLRAIGERDTASDFVGPSRFVALALRVDAHEKLGERRLARQLWISYSRGNAFVLQGTAAALGLAVETRRANQRRALVVLPVGFVTLWALVTMILRIIDHEPVGTARLVVGVVGFIVVVASRRL